jgi:hypothetical protein
MGTLKTLHSSILLFITSTLAINASGQSDSTRQKGNGVHFYANVMSGINKYSLAPDSYYEIKNHYGSSIAAGLGLEYKRANRYIVSLGGRLSQKRGYSELSKETHYFFLQHNQISIEVPVLLGYQFNRKSGMEILTLYAGATYVYMGIGNRLSIPYAQPSYLYANGLDPENIINTSALYGSIKLSKNVGRFKPLGLRLFVQGDFQFAKANEPLTLYFYENGSSTRTARGINLLSRSLMLGIDMIF